MINALKWFKFDADLFCQKLYPKQADENLQKNIWNFQIFSLIIMLKLDLEGVFMISY